MKIWEIKGQLAYHFWLQKFLENLQKVIKLLFKMLYECQNDFGNVVVKLFKIYGKLLTEIIQLIYLLRFEQGQ